MISVIVPTYNYSRYIGGTLSSVLAQTYDDFEVVVVDDGSVDDTREVVKSLRDPRIRYYYQENQGACVARNRGIEEAKGDYLVFQDADDLMEPEHLASYVAVGVQNPGANIYGPSYRVRLVDGEFEVLSKKGKCPGDDLLEHWLGNWSIVPNCILWPRQNVEKVGGWDETLHANQDGDIAMRALIAGIPFVYAEEAPPAKHLRHEHETEQISAVFNEKTLTSKIKVLEKIEYMLDEGGNLARKYKNALAKLYYQLALRTLDSYPDISDYCFLKYRKLYGLRKPPGTYLNWFMVLLLGLRRKEKLAELVGDRIPWRF